MPLHSWSNIHSSWTWYSPSCSHTQGTGMSHRKPLFCLRVLSIPPLVVRSLHALKSSHLLFQKMSDAPAWDTKQGWSTCLGGQITQLSPWLISIKFISTGKAQTVQGSKYPLLQFSPSSPEKLLTEEHNPVHFIFPMPLFLTSHLCLLSFFLLKARHAQQCGNRSQFQQHQKKQAGLFWGLGCCFQP